MLREVQIPDLVFSRLQSARVAVEKKERELGGTIDDFLAHPDLSLE